jgi:hypothetical protein
MPQYAAYNATTLAVSGLVDSATAPVAVAGSPFAYGLLAAPSSGFPSAPNTGSVLRYSAASQSLFWDDGRTVAQTRTERVGVLRVAREAAVAATFTWDGSPFDSDQVSQTRIALLAIAATQSGYTETPWRLADNTWRTLSASDALAVAVALAAHLRTQYDRFNTRETSVKNAASKTAVDAVTW